MAGARWIVTEHRGPEGLAAVEADWRRLYAEMPCPALWHSFEAHQAFVEHLCESPGSFRCFTLSDGERVRAIIPLEERWDRGLFEGGIGLRMRVLGMPWRKENWALTDAVGSEDEARRALLPAVVEHLRRQPGRPAVLALGRVRDTSALLEGLEDIAPWARVCFVDECEYVIPTGMPVRAFMERLSRNARQILKKAKRRFEALDDAAYARATGVQELALEYGAFVEVEASGWKGRHGSSIRQRAGEEGFYRALTERLELDGHCEIHSLHAEGRCIASAFWVYTPRGCVCMKIGYDEAFAHVSPGRLLTQMSLERCCEDPNVDEASFLGDAAWLSHWLPAANLARRAYVSLRPVTGPLFIVLLRIRYGPVRGLARTLRRLRHGRADTTVARPDSDPR